MTARARHAATSFSEASANKSAGSPSAGNRVELVDLAQQRLQARPARGRPSARPADDSQPRSVDVVLAAPVRQPRRASVRSQNCCSNAARADADDPLHPTRRLDPLSSAAHQQRLAQLLVTQLDRAHLLGQPVGQLVLIAASELAKPEHIPDLRAVILDRPAADQRYSASSPGPP